MKRIGFVTPWYGEKIGGGAEAELRGLVHHLKEAGLELEVLTTCAESFQSDWSRDYHEQGLTVEAGIPVRRFRTRKRNTARFDELNRRLMKGEHLTKAAEEEFCRENVNSPELYAYIREHGEDYSLFVMIPYLYGTTYYGCRIHPEKTILIPCLHDECYARMKCFRNVFSSVRGMIFHAEAEKALAEKLYGIRGDTYPVLGEGLDTGWTADADLFRQKTGIHSPFILCAGRKDAGKRVDVLVRYFAAFRNALSAETRLSRAGAAGVREARGPGDLKLVLIGGGSIDNPDPKNILDLGYVDPEVKYSACAAAECLCNPSEMESFSLVVMESWLAGRPVLVNSRCQVTKDFARRAGGGLWYGDYPEFAACLNWLLAHPDMAARMGRNGRTYVLERYSWDIIVREYTAFFRRICESRQKGPQ